MSYNMQWNINVIYIFFSEAQLLTCFILSSIEFGVINFLYFNLGYPEICIAILSVELDITLKNVNIETVQYTDNKHYMTVFIDKCITVIDQSLHYILLHSISQIICGMLCIIIWLLG